MVYVKISTQTSDAVQGVDAKALSKHRPASATNHRITEACQNTALFRRPIYSLEGGAMSNRAYWRGFTSTGFVERGRFVGLWAVPAVICVLWALPRPYIFDKIGEIIYGAEEE